MPSLTVSLDTPISPVASSTLFVESLDPAIPPCTITVSAPCTPRPPTPKATQQPSSIHSTCTPTPTTQGFFRQGSSKVLHQLAKAQTSLKQGAAKLTPKHAKSKSSQNISEKSNLDQERVSSTTSMSVSNESSTDDMRKSAAVATTAVATTAGVISTAEQRVDDSNSTSPKDSSPATKPSRLSLLKKSKNGKKQSALCEADAGSRSDADADPSTATTDDIPESSEIVEKKHRDPNRVLLSSTVGGMTPYEFLGMILDKRFEEVMRKHKPAMGYRTLLKEGEYKPAKAPWHKEKGQHVIVHSNRPESIITKVMRTAHAISYIKVPEDCNASSDSIRGTFKVVVPKFKRVVDVHGDMTITKLDDGRLSIATDVFLKLNIPLIGGFVANFLRTQMKVGYKILPALVADYLEYPEEPHPLETMKFD